MGPDSKSIRHFGFFIEQNGGSDMKFLSIFFQVLFFISHRHFKNRQILTLEFFKKLAEGRRLLPAVPSVRGKEIENDHAALEIA